MNSLYSSYERLAKVYAKKAGINLIIRGGGFSTDGKKIVIAEIPDKLNKTLRDPALAGLVHECNHIKHSWFPRNKEEAKKKNLDEFQTRYKGLINNLEDVRILHLGRKEYPGMDSLQSSGLKFIKKSFLKQKIKDRKIPLSSLLGMCIQWKESNEDSSFFPPSINAMAKLTRDIWHGVKWNPYEKGHEEAENIVKRIIKRLKQQQKNISSKGSDKNQEGQKEEKEEREEGEGGEKKEKDEEDEKEEGSNKDRIGKPAYEKEQAKKEIPQPSNEISKTDYNGEDLEEDLENLFNEEIEETFPTDGGGLMEIMTEIIETTIQNHNTNLQKHIPHPEIVIYDREEHIKNPLKEKKINSYDLQEYKKRLRDTTKQIDKETEKLKAKALPLLMAEKRDSFIYEQKEGTIDGAQLYKLQKGNGNIYKQKVLGKRINTAVTILCDVSGSMRMSKIRMLRSTLLVIGDTMFSLKIPFEILSYTTCHDSNPKILKIKENLGKHPYNRIEPLLLTIVKDFNENYINIRGLIPMMDASNNTPTNEAFKWGCKRLIQRNENRKILFILEDGQPSLERSDRFLLEKDLKENVIQAEKSSIEVIGIGLLSDSVKEFYKNFIVIDNINEISIKVYKALLETLKTYSQKRR